MLVLISSSVPEKCCTHVKMRDILKRMCHKIIQNFEESRWILRKSSVCIHKVEYAVSIQDSYLLCKTNWMTYITLNGTSKGNKGIPIIEWWWWWWWYWDGCYQVLHLGKMADNWLKSISLYASLMKGWFLLSAGIWNYFFKCCILPIG